MIFASVYHWFPKVTGRMMDENLGRFHFLLTFIGFNLCFAPQHWLGLNGMPRRVAEYDPQFAFVNQIKSIAGESDVVMAQVESNTRVQAMKGNLPGAVQQAVVRALSSHQKLATQVLKSDRQGMSALVDVIYEMLRDGKNLDLDLD